MDIRTARTRARVTAEQAANELGVRKGTLYSWERYETLPDILQARKMAALYGVDLSELNFIEPIKK